MQKCLLSQMRRFDRGEQKQNNSNFKLECHMFHIPNTLKFPAICSINFHCERTQNVSDKFFKGHSNAGDYSKESHRIIGLMQKTLFLRKNLLKNLHNRETLHVFF